MMEKIEISEVEVKRILGLICELFESEKLPISDAIIISQTLMGSLFLTAHDLSKYTDTDFLKEVDLAISSVKHVVIDHILKNKKAPKLKKKK
jgi:hypothetical protein